MSNSFVVLQTSGLRGLLFMAVFAAGLMICVKSYAGNDQGTHSSIPDVANTQIRYRNAYQKYKNLNWQPPAAVANMPQFKDSASKLKQRQNSKELARLADIDVLTIEQVNAQEPIHKVELEAFLDWWPKFSQVARHTGGSVENMQKIVKSNKWNWPRFYTIWMRLIAFDTRQNSADTAKLGNRDMMLLQTYGPQISQAFAATTNAQAQ